MSDYEWLSGRATSGEVLASETLAKHYAEKIVGIARILGLSAIVNAGAANGPLIPQIRRLGMPAAATDLWPDSRVSVSRTAAEVSESVAGLPRLTVCLNVIEHIDRDDLPSALANLHALTERYLLVLVSSEPPADDNLYHAPVLPQSSWRALTDLAGFDVVADDRLREILDDKAARSDGHPGFVTREWWSINPYREHDAGASRWLVLVKSESRSPEPAENGKWRRILRLDQRPVSPLPDIPDTFRATCLLGLPQDYSVLQPLFERLPSRHLNVLLRTGPEPHMREHDWKLVASRLHARGLPVYTVDSAGRAPWDEIAGPHSVFISASESNTSAYHLEHLQYVIRAQEHGMDTFLLQHGIWVEPFEKPILFGSKRILSWADEHRQFFRQRRTDDKWKGEPVGYIDNSSFTVTGCPKFDSYAVEEQPDRAFLFGDWTKEFERCVLFTTNLHWRQHLAPPVNLLTRIVLLAERQKDVLFVVKLHPMEDPAAYLAEFELPRNVLLLNDRVGLRADIRTSDLIRSADVVVSTLSTTVLECGLAGKPVFLLDTGHAYTYRYLEATPLAHVEKQLIAREPGQLCPKEFVSHYYDQSRLGRALYACVKELTREGAASETRAPRVRFAIEFARDFATRRSSPAPAAEETASAAPVYDIQLYWADDASGFSSQNACTVQAKVSQKPAHVRIEFPGATGTLRALRLDPANRCGLIEVEHFRITRPGHGLLWEFRPDKNTLAGLPAHGLVFVSADPVSARFRAILLNYDPGFEVPVPESVLREVVAGSIISFDIKWSSDAEDIGLLIQQVQAEAAEVHSLLGTLGPAVRSVEELIDRTSRDAAASADASARVAADHHQQVIDALAGTESALSGLAAEASRGSTEFASGLGAVADANTGLAAVLSTLAEMQRGLQELRTAPREDAGLVSHIRAAVEQNQELAAALSGRLEDLRTRHEQIANWIPAINESLAELIENQGRHATAMASGMNLITRTSQDSTAVLSNRLDTLANYIQSVAAALGRSWSSALLQYRSDQESELRATACELRTAVESQHSETRKELWWAANSVERQLVAARVDLESRITALDSALAAVTENVGRIVEQQTAAQRASHDEILLKLSQLDSILTAELNRQISLAVHDLDGGFGRAVRSMQAECLVAVATLREITDHIRLLAEHGDATREDVRFVHEAVAGVRTSIERIEANVAYSVGGRQLAQPSGLPQGDSDNAGGVVDNQQLALTQSMSNGAIVLPTGTSVEPVATGPVDVVKRLLLNRKGVSTKLARKYASRRIGDQAVSAIVESGLFDEAYYLELYADVRNGHIDPLTHYLLFGFSESRSTHPLFDGAYYAAQRANGDDESIPGLLHFITTGWRERLSPHRLFDLKYIIRQRPELLDNDVNPLALYLRSRGRTSFNPHPLFDSSYYLESNPDVVAAGSNPLIHYITFGKTEFRSPHPLFDVGFYLSHHPNAAAASRDPLDYLLTNGVSEQVDPHPLFHVAGYTAQYPEARSAGVHPLLHFVDEGWRGNRNPTFLFDTAYVRGQILERAAETDNPVVFYLRNSDSVNPHPLFDSAHYFAQKPELRAHRTNPLIHYLTAPPQARANPHPLFDLTYYLSENPDVVSVGIDPIRHYLNHGASEGRNPNPLFWSSWYISQNSDVRDSGSNPLLHFILFGAREGRAPNPLFDTRFYVAANADVRDSGMNPLTHYLQHGGRELRKPCDRFDSAFYVSTYPEAAAYPNPLLHYFQVGKDKGAWVNRSGFAVHAGQSARPGQPPEFAYTPKISVCVPEYNQDPRYLEKLVECLYRQTYSNWELIIADDGSTRQDTLAYLRTLARRDVSKINVVFIGVNQGISAVNNAAIYMATGEYVAMVDSDDELSPEALEEIVRALNTDPSIDVIYTDEDKEDPEGWLNRPFFKPDWSPEYFRHVMYICHLLVVRRTLAVEIGGMDARFNWIQDYDFMVRLSERTSNIHHIPRVLYHWRMIPGSLAMDANQKKDMRIGELQCACVNQHLVRKGIHAEAVPLPHAPHRVSLSPLPREKYPAVSIVIPTRDKPELIGRCLDSIFEKSSYPELEVVLVDNGTTDPEALEIFSRYPVRVVPYPGRFNYSEANNKGAEVARGEYLVLLNNDTEVITANWIEQMLIYAEQEDVGAVSAKLLFPGGTVQHAGVVLGMRGTADHIMRGFPRDSDGYFGTLSASREVSAVTGACLMLKRSLYDQLGGLDPRFRTIYQDLDLCLRLRKQGLRNVYVGQVELYHHESPSRGNSYDYLDRALILDMWGDIIRKGDPYFNPNFVIGDTGYTQVPC